MKILSVEHVVPKTRLTNEETIDRLSQASKDYLSADELVMARHHVQFLFSISGAATRYVTDGKEQPLDLVVAAAKAAINRAGISAHDLDFILFGSVSRRYLVPSNAAVIQDALGAGNSTCFDILDACASWARALQVADKFLAGKSSGVGLVVSNETGGYDQTNPWEIKSVDDIKLLVGALTLGEAATATIVTSSHDDQFRFFSKTYGQYSDLAVLPVSELSGHGELGIADYEPLKFYTQTGELTKQGLKAAINTLEEADFFRDGPADCFVPHAGAEASVDTFLKITKIPVNKLVMTYREYGNTVSSSIPLGLSLATKDMRITRGDRVFVATAAAGISTVGALFEY